MPFNEDSRVKIPAILHLTRLGYTYLSLKTANWDKETNIFKDIFFKSVQSLNPETDLDDIKRYYEDLSLLVDNEDLSLLVDNEDLGQKFYEKLMARSGIRIIDFEDFDNNDLHVVTELPYEKDEDSFRPDVILLINGMPLVFIEVKKPNNKEGIIAERNRIYRRFQNKKFRKFINITQLMVFSNNMEYDDTDVEPLQGAYYATTSYERPPFNYFREEEQTYLDNALLPLNEEEEDYVLKDNNLVSIKQSEEFKTNKLPNTPTNRICTSLFSKERIAYFLRYSIAYVKGSKGLQKHVMRYPQFFASEAVVRKLDGGVRQGIIWHTQGSGKTALAYYCVHILTDYFQSKSIVPKFYFIVDRLDLLTQASREFSARGLKVRKVNSKEDFAKEIKSTLAVHNDSGEREITVVNIQKFKDDPAVVQNTDYAVDLQRIYFLDEVHRSYNPQGSFLANLKESDPNSIKIGLTGTPLLGNDYNSRQLFGNYIHKYYYNASIIDGYTLRLIREEIETTYRLKLQKALEDIQILKGDIDRKLIYSHHKFAEPMLDYIIEDFEKARLMHNDNSIGAMVVCDSSEQARAMYSIFQSKGANYVGELPMAADEESSYGNKLQQERKVKSAALILHDAGTKEERKGLIEDFKDGKIDLLFVYNMLLTGFDAPRLKKLYLGRVVRSHNLLQALTRVNRRHKQFKFGYVVDFADIQKEFDKTNKAYFDELQNELGDDLEHYSNLFLTAEEIDSEISVIKDVLFYFDTINKETFSQQISEIQDKGKMLEIVKALNSAKSLYNLIRLTGQYELLDRLDFRQLNVLSSVGRQTKVD